MGDEELIIVSDVTVTLNNCIFSFNTVHYFLCMQIVIYSRHSMHIINPVYVLKII